MMMKMEAMRPSQQDMDLIDILWNQDIDLGARREVFDYNHRQKEHELQQQQKLEEEKRLHLLREQEKALLAQLQLDEETGEYIPRIPLPSAVTPLENAAFREETGSSLSLDECLQLLAETFPVEEAEGTPVSVDAPTVSMHVSGNIVVSPEQPALSPASLLPGQLPAPQQMSSDVEQAWMEILSLPELQQCLNMQLEDTRKTTTYPLANTPGVQNPNYPNHPLLQTPTFYPMPSLAEVKTNILNVGPAEFMNAPDPSVAPPDPLGQMKAGAPELSSNFPGGGFCDIFYPNTALENSSGHHGLEGDKSMTDASKEASFTPMDLYNLSPEDEYESGKNNPTADILDSDSGISTNSSPNSSSPSKSVTESYGFSDSDMEETDYNSGSAEIDYSEMFSMNFQPDDLEPAQPASPLGGELQQQLEEELNQHTVDPAEESGHSSAPFTKDKAKKRSGVRLSRDELRAKALKIPFTVDMIINLAVDDFNELMSKHQLNEAQLALVRDIRRRGKNKVAAQNCRKRKMENIVGLETDLDSLKEEKERLLDEKSKNATDLKDMKRQLQSLYLEVFGKLRDEKGNGYSPSEYSLQQSTDGSIFLVPRIKKTFKLEDSHASPL